MKNSALARQVVKAPIFECIQSRTQIEPEELGERHREVGMGVGVGGELRDVELLMANDAPDGSAGLALMMGLGSESGKSGASFGATTRIQ